MVGSMSLVILAVLAATPARAARPVEQCKKLDVAAAQLEQGDPRGALACLANLENRKKLDRAGFHYLRGQAHWTLGRPEHAVADFRRAIEERIRQGYQNPQIELDPAWHAVLGQAYFAAGRYADARESFERAGDAVQTRPDWIVLHGEALRETGDPEAAWAVFEAGLAGHPDHRELLRRRAYLAFVTERWSEAVQAASRLVEVAGDQATEADRALLDQAREQIAE